MRMQSPKTRIKSGETWDIEGCALANKTWQGISDGPGRGLRKGSTSSAHSIGPGMLVSIDQRSSAEKKRIGHTPKAWITGQVECACDQLDSLVG
jgi:hypothetical protein